MVILSHRCSLSGAAQILKVNPKTVAKKLSFLGEVCRKRLAKDGAQYSGIEQVQFDEGTVAKKERKILGLQVSKMPATGC